MYTPATRLPDLAIFRWSRPDAPNPRLAAPLSASLSDNTVKFTSPPLDNDGAVIQKAFVFGVTNSRGFSENICVPAGALSTDGLIATGVTRGLRPDGLDLTTGDVAFVAEHEADSPVYCAVNAVFFNIWKAATGGSVATNGSEFTIGRDSEETITIYRVNGDGTRQGFLRWNNTSGKVEFSNNGAAWTANSDVTSSTLVDVSSNDTTPGYLEDKIVAGGNITVTITNDGGDEDIQISFDPTGLGGDGVTIDGGVFRLDLGSGLEFASGKVAVKLDPEGGLSSSDLGLAQAVRTKEYLLGENVTVSGDPVALAQLPGVIQANIENANIMDYDPALFYTVADSSSNYAYASQFSVLDPSALGIKIKKVKVRAMLPTGLVTECTIRAREGSVPSFTNLGLASITTVVTNQALMLEYDFGEGVEVTSGEVYFSVFRRPGGATSAAGYKLFKQTSSFQIPRSIGMYNANASNSLGSGLRGNGVNWDSLSGDQVSVEYELEIDYGTKVVRARSTDAIRRNFVGFLTEPGIEDEVVNVRYDQILDGFSALSDGVQCLSTVLGGLTSTPNPESVIPVGKKINENELQIDTLLPKTITIPQFSTQGDTDGTVTATYYYPSGVSPITRTVAGQSPEIVNYDGVNVYYDIDLPNAGATEASSIIQGY